MSSMTWRVVFTLWATVCLVHGQGAKGGGGKNTTNKSKVTTVAPVFSNSETNCFAQRKVLYAGDGQCYELQQKGPCPTGQWLVLDVAQAVNGTGQLEPVCKPCPCCAKNLGIYWPADATCHKVTERMTLCPHPGTELLNDPFGEGECACRRDPPHVSDERDLTDPKRGPGGAACHQLYLQGPCPKRMILVSVVKEGYGRVGRCERDPCYSTTARMHNGTYALYAKDNMCYRLEGRGPCEGAQVFKVSLATHKPHCLSPGNSIFQLPERCKTDTAGDCEVEISLEKDEKKLYAQELLMSRDRKRRKTRNSLK